MVEESTCIDYNSLIDLALGKSLSKETISRMIDSLIYKKDWESI